jgi:hypothetical protein
MKTVKQLIAELSEYPEDMIVVTNGYEGGFRDIREPEELVLVLDYYRGCWWMGPHEEVEEYHTGISDARKVKAIKI